MWYEALSTDCRTGAVTTDATGELWWHDVPGCHRGLGRAAAPGADRERAPGTALAETAHGQRRQAHRRQHRVHLLRTRRAGSQMSRGTTRRRHGRKKPVY